MKATSLTPFVNSVMVKSFALAAIVMVAACDGGESSTGETGGKGGETGGSGGSGGSPGTGGMSTGMGGSSTTSGSGGTTNSTTTTSGSGAGGPVGSMCAKEPPAGSAVPDPLPDYTGGACPTLVEGENTITSKGNTRKFILVLPKDLTVAEHPPILFLWHWLGGSAEDFLEEGQIQQAADEQRFVAVVPRSKGDGQFQWPFDTTQSEARMEEEYTFFDDMLTCTAKQVEANLNCVGSAGVSAGALFTDQLAAHRANRISSFISLSGGTGGVIRPWGKPEKKLPGLVLWGGPTDTCLGLLSFETLSKTLESDLTSEGNFFVECIHNCGHSAPPLDPAADGSSIFGSLWGFFLDHPYWLKDGESPYQMNGLPANMPEWCGIGKGSATPRVGPCNGGGC
ncbi:MAG: hypothetical protein IPK82_25245 [Polyangiaceae bacterium]|nr:hypothetical protein [Polyangiaceae bacterium]